MSFLHGFLGGVVAVVFCLYVAPPLLFYTIFALQFAWACVKRLTDAFVGPK